ncbi:MAG: hypothetical protein AAFP77_19640 [Bacteroidota bacterium]
MTTHDYREVWNFLYRSGMKADDIPGTGREAWRAAKDRGFVESSEWGHIPGQGYAPERLANPFRWTLKVAGWVALATVALKIIFSISQ